MADTVADTSENNHPVKAEHVNKHVQHNAPPDLQLCQRF